MSYEVSDFNTEVIEASGERPILVDFWAPWCGPCRMLSPTLEKLAEEAGDKWSLVTVNTDEHPDLAMSYQVRGIPAVKLFSDGEVVGEFTGAMPEYAVKQWLDQQIPSESSKSISSARELVEEGRIDDAVKLLEDLTPDPEVSVLLASLIVLDEPERAIELISSATGVSGPSERIKSAVETVAEAMVAVDRGEVPEGPGHNDYEQAVRNLHDGDVENSVKSLMQVLIKDRYYADDAARKLGVALFTLLGDTHSLTRDLRRTFDMYLY